MRPPAPIAERAPLIRVVQRRHVVSQRRRVAVEDETAGIGQEANDVVPRFVAGRVQLRNRFRRAAGLGDAIDGPV